MIEIKFLFHVELFKLFPGEIEKPCILKIKNDTLHEADKMLRLVLGSPQSQTAGTALVDSPNETNVTISDDSDRKYKNYFYLIA